MITDAIISALNFLCWLIPIIIIGILLADLVVELKLVRALGFLMTPITRFAHLSPECGVSFLTAFGSPQAANSMLMEFYNKNLISRKELFIASLATAFPVIVMHLPYMLPVLIPMVGFPGLIYFCMLVLGGFIITFITLSAGRLLLPQKDDIMEIKKEQRPLLKEALKTSIRNSKKTILRILSLTIPITIVVFILIDLGLFQILALYLSGVAIYFPIPPEGLTIIAAQLANFNIACAVAGSLFAEGVLSSKEIVLSLLVGDIFANITVLRFLIPYYLGIFGPKLGTQIMLLSTSLRVGVTVIIITILALMW